MINNAKASSRGVEERVDLSGKWRVLLLMSLAELLAMATWFSATAVLPALTEAWSLSDGGRAWLTMSVQIGFVAGALLSTLFNVADRVRGGRLFAASAVLAGIATALIPLFAHSLPTALALRFLTGFFLAGVYPIGMKIMATWTRADRGLAIGLLVGALVIGSASPHLLNAAGGGISWRFVMGLAAASAFLGGLIAALFVREGPYAMQATHFDLAQTRDIVRQRDVVLANLGYLGHMWELFAMWSWIPLFLLASFQEQQVDPVWASLAAFAVIAVGGPASLLAGRLADQYGRTAVTASALALSGLCSLTIGFLFGANPWLVLFLALVWGAAIVADSAQFSAAVSELSDPRYVGTSLTLQTTLGFLLTLFTIRMIPPLQAAVGWRYAFVILALGPLVGIWAMLRLRHMPQAAELANGHR